MNSRWPEIKKILKYSLLTNGILSEIKKIFFLITHKNENKNLELSQYQSIVELKLTSYNETFSGFIDIVFCITELYISCQKNKKYLYLNTKNFYYGDWENFFIPFWSEKELKKLKQKKIPIEYTPFQGVLTHGVISYLTKYHFSYKNLIQLNQKTKDKIYCEINQLPKIDLVIHIRCYGGSTPMKKYIKKVDWLLKLFDEEIKTIFIMTDIYSSFEYFKQYLPNKTVITLCPKYYDGVESNIRGVENLYLLLKEVEIAKKSKFFIGLNRSQVSRELIIQERKEHSYVV